MQSQHAWSTQPMLDAPHFNTRPKGPSSTLAASSVQVEKAPAAKPPAQSPSASGKKKSAPSPKQAKQQQQQQPAPKVAAAPPASKKRSKVVESDDEEDAIEDDEAVVVVAGRKGAAAGAAKAKGSDGAANGKRCVAAAVPCYCALLDWQQAKAGPKRRKGLVCGDAKQLAVCRLLCVATRRTALGRSRAGVGRFAALRC